MKKKTKYNFGGAVDSISGVPGLEDLIGLLTNNSNNDPTANFAANRYKRLSSKPNNIEAPGTAIADHNIAMARAMDETNSNPWTQGLDILGSMAIQYGSSMMSKGQSQGGSFGDVFKKAAYGGRLSNVPVEVEGDEIGQLPNGGLIDFQGPSHENGGIDALLPEGTTMFSKRIKIDGKTMADRKKAREKQTAKLEKLNKDNSTDLLIKNAMKRNQEVSKAEDDFDLELQGEVAKMFEGTNAENTNNKVKLQGGTGRSGIRNPFVFDPKNKEHQVDFQNWYDTNYKGDTGVVPGWGAKSKAAYKTHGGIYNIMKNQDYQNPVNINEDNQIPAELLRIMPTMEDQIASDKLITEFQEPDAGNFDSNILDEEDSSNNSNWLNKLFGGAGTPTVGDALGMYGNLRQAYKPRSLTLEERSGDSPNINAFKDFGKDALKVIEDSKGYVAGIRDEALNDLELARTGSIRRNRNTARGVNTQRALDLASDAGANRAMTDVHSNFAEQIMGILGQQAQMESMQDQMVMQGEEKRDTADRMDRGAFYTNLARDERNIGEALARTGKSANEIKGRGVNENLLNSMTEYANVNVMNGTMSAKEGLEVAGDKNKYIDNYTKNKGYKNLLGGEGYTDAEWNALSLKQREKAMREPDTKITPTKKTKK